MKVGARNKDIDFDSTPATEESVRSTESRSPSEYEMMVAPARRRTSQAGETESASFGQDSKNVATNPAVGRSSYAMSVATIISALAVIHYLWIIARPSDVLVRFVPDDGFYDLQLARHFLATGVWSFDRGVTTTTGFHLLNVYLMSLFPQIFVHPMLAARFWMGVGVALSAATAFVICRFAERTFGSFALLPVFLVLTARFVVLGNVSLLEFPFVVLIAAFYASAMLRERCLASRRILIEVFVLGLVGSLARSDFGGLPLVLAGACVIRWAWIGRRDYLPQSVWGLIGATVGLVLVSVHNFVLSGHWLSGSAMVKKLWGQRVGYSIRPGFEMLNSAIVSSPWELRWVGVIIEVGVVICMARAILGMRTRDGHAERHADRVHDDGAFLTCSGLATLGLFLFVYGFDKAALGPWYLANFVIPMVLVLGSAAHWIECKPEMQVCAAIAILSILPAQVEGPYRPRWNFQSRMYRMAEYIQRHPVDGRIAGWSVGIVGYMLDGRVINLDGLVNDQIFPYIRDSKVERYLDQMRIAYVVDDPVMMHYPAIARVYGYDIVQLENRLRPIHTETSADDKDDLFDDTLYQVRAEPGRSAAIASPDRTVNSTEIPRQVAVGLHLPQP